MTLPDRDWQDVQLDAAMGVHEKERGRSLSELLRDRTCR